MSQLKENKQMIPRLKIISKNNWFLDLKVLQMKRRFKKKTDSLF